MVINIIFTARTRSLREGYVFNQLIMHSSRMRTGRTLTVFRKIGDPPEKLETPPEKLETPRKLQPPPGTDLQGMLGYPPPPRQTHACENITLAKTSFRPVIMPVCLLGGGSM